MLNKEKKVLVKCVEETKKSNCENDKQRVAFIGFGDCDLLA